MPRSRHTQRPKRAEHLNDLMTSAKSGNPETIRHKASEIDRDLNSVYIGGKTLLTKAIEDNEAPSTIEAIIRAGADVNYPNSHGKTALMMAVKAGLPELVTVLIQYGADPKHKTPKCISAISLCLIRVLYSCLEILLRQSMNNVDSICDHLEEICYFLRRRNDNEPKGKNNYDFVCPFVNMDPRLISAIKNVYDVNIKDMNGNTPLMYAVRCHYDDCVRLLLLAGADVNRINKSKDTALTLAMTRSHNPILKDLIRAGALRRHPRGKTSTLHFGMFKMILDYLQQNGLFYTPDIYGKTALMYAAERGDKECIMHAVQMDIEEFFMANFLLNDKEPSAPCLGDGYDDESFSCLCTAIETERNFKRNDKQLMKDMNIYQDNNGRPIIMYAFETGQMLLDSYIQSRVSGSVEYRDRHGRTLLMNCFKFYKQNTCSIDTQLILIIAQKNTPERKSSIMSSFHLTVKTIEGLFVGKANLRDKSGDSTVIYAIRYCDFLTEEITKLLVGDTHKEQYRDGKTALMIAVSGYNGGSHTYIQPLIGDSCSIQDKDGKTALMYALMNKKLVPDDLLKQLIGDSQNMKDKGGKTALMYAFIHKKQFSQEMIELLAGETPFIQDDAGKTALMYAFECNQYLTYSRIQKLFGSKADIRDNEGKTQLIYALQFYAHINEEIANLLVGDTHKAQYQHGKTALMIALENKNNLDSILHFIQSLIDCSCNAQDSSGHTALMYAMRHNCRLPEHLFDQMIRKSQFIQDKEGKTALMHAYPGSYSLNTLIIKLFHRDALNIQDKEGKTALHHAIEHDQADEYIKQLILHGSNHEIEDNHKRTVLVMCLQCDTRDTVFIYQWGNNFTKTKMLLRYNQMARLGLLGKQIILKSIKIGLFSLYSLFNNKEIFRLMIVNGIVPFPHLLEIMSTFFAILQKNLIDVVKYLIANMYLTNEDLVLLIKAKNYLKSNDYPRKQQMLYNGTYLDLSSPDLQHLITEATSQPWPLVKLSFVVVSSAVGHGTNREDRVNRLPLPNPIKDSLMFNTRTALIPVSEWTNIPMVFDPVEYENTRRLRPLLKYWPFGAELVV